MQFNYAIFLLYECLANLGWNAGSKVFSDMVSESESRRKFIQSAFKFLRSRNLDGLGNLHYSVLTAFIYKYIYI